jgi:hypothetical protein
MRKAFLLLVAICSFVGSTNAQSCIGQGSITVSIQQAPTAVIMRNGVVAPYRISACRYSYVTLYSQMTGAGFTYTWYRGRVDVTADPTSPSLRTKAAGTFTLVVRNAAGCVQSSSTVDLVRPLCTAVTAAAETAREMEDGNEGIGSIALYPNPANQELTVLCSTETPYSKVSIRVFDVLGRVALQQQATTNDQSAISLDVSHLIDGTYFLEVSDGNQRFVERVIVAH